MIEPLSPVAMAGTSGIHFSPSAINNNNRLRPRDKHAPSSNRHCFNMSSSDRISRGWPSSSLLFLLFFTTTSLAHLSQWTHDKPTTAHSREQISQILKANESIDYTPRVQRQFDARSSEFSSKHTKDHLEQSRKKLIDLIDKHARSQRSSDAHAESIKNGGGGGEEQEVAAISHEQASKMTNSTQITSSMTSALISATTTTTTAAPSNITKYTTINYNGVIGVNATDPFAIATESRSFGLPIEIQILMCLLYGTLAFTAVTSNLTVCYIVLSNQRMRTATNYFIVNLAVGDILMALLCIPFTFPANLIFQYWPFGLSLCVIVSYSQALSVFISAYTMVAISIDKYIAIMYPMRLRMPKNQAKMIILVIWSAALVTSLPTALLSSLAPATPDLGPSQPTTTPSSFNEIVTPASVYTNPSIPTNSLFGSATTTTTKSYLSSSQTKDNITVRDERERLVSASSSSSLSGANKSSSTKIPTTAARTRQEQSQQQQNQDYEEQKKYFCQESWLVWPGGKYYYSMALMVLQFVVPLFVLVVTYTRIVIVVWGKRVPGEEDDARDARMARSKRKMIRMVILCVIAFALTWLPFNALIVIGDMRPDIWENQNIMYIWFITHYLAMCHTITNPLIYIWMNNRFRAGFIQVVGDVCRFLHRLFAYLLCHCLCMGCCLDCSRQKYARVEQNINRKRARQGPLASSGSIHAHNYHNNNGKSGATNNQHPQHHYNTQTTAGGGGGGGVADRGDGHKTLSSNDYCTKVTSSGQIMAANNGNTHLDQKRPGQGSTTIFIKTASGNNPLATTSNPVASTSEGVAAELAQEGARTAGRAISSGPELQSSHAPQSRGNLIAPSRTLTIARGIDLGGGKTTSARRPAMCLKRERLFRHDEPTDDISYSDGCSYSASRNHCGPPSTSSPAPLCNSGSDLGTVDQRLMRSHEGQSAANIATGQHQSTAAYEKMARKKRRKRHSHGISLHMTQPYRVIASSTTHTGSRDVGNMNVATVVNHEQLTTSKWRAAVGVRRSKGKQQQAGPSYSSECPSCQSTSLSMFSSAKSREARKESADAHVRFQKFMYEFRNSSQSTATISAQTNNTSLAITPLDSATGGGPNGESANTSASLSPSGLDGAASCPDGGLSSRSTRRRAYGGGDGSDALDNSITVIRSEQANEPLTGAQLDRSSEPVKIGSSEGVDPLARKGAGKTMPLAVDGATAQSNGLKLVRGDATTTKSTANVMEQIARSMDGPVESVAASPLECASYQAGPDEIKVGAQQRQEHLPHRRQSADAGAIGVSHRLRVNEIDARHHAHSHNHHRDSGGTLSEATSLEGHQLASSTSASESCNQSDPAHSGRQHLSDGSAVVSSKLKFCLEHRKTGSAAEVDSRDHHCDHRRRKASFPSTHATSEVGPAVSNERDVDPLHDEHRLRYATATFCSPLNEIGTRVERQQEFTSPGLRRSSSTFGLVSEHLLHVKQLPCAGSAQQEPEQEARAMLAPVHHHHHYVHHGNVDEQGYLHTNGEQESFSSNNDDDDDDSSLEAEYGEIRRDLEYRFAGNLDEAESIQLRPLAAKRRDNNAARQAQPRNRLFSSTSDGLCSTHSHDDNRRHNEDSDLTRDLRTSRVTLATCIAPTNSQHNLLVEFKTGYGGQRGASNKMDHGSTVINFCDIPNKTQPGWDLDGAKMVRKSSLHNRGDGNQRRIHPTNNHLQHTKSMSPIHLGRQGSFIVAATATDTAIHPNRARNF